MIKHSFKWFSVKAGLCSVAFLLLSDQAVAQESGAVHIGVVRIAKQFDAMKASDSASLRLMQLTSPGLLGGGRNMPEGYGLAEDVSQNAEATAYTVKLKSGLLNHAGEKIDAEYISSYYAKLRDSLYARTLYDVSDVVVEDDLTLTFNLKKPNPWFWSALDLPVANTGPYKVAEKSASRLVVAPVKSASPTLVFHESKNPMVRYLKLERGEVDVLHNDLPVEIFGHGESKGFTPVAVPSASYTYLGLQLEKAPLNDVKVRKALSLAINKGALTGGLMGGHARAASSLLMEDEFGYWGAPEEVYNPSEAMALLDEAGYRVNEEGVRFTLRLNVTTNPFVQRIAQVIQQDFKKVGIDLSIEAREWGAFYRDVKKGNFEAYILSWVGPFSADIYKHLFHSDALAPAGLNRGRLQDEQMDRLLDEMMVASNRVRREELAQAVQKYQHENVLYIPLWRGHHLSLASKNIHGYAPRADGGYLSFTTISK